MPVLAMSTQLWLLLTDRGWRWILRVTQRRIAGLQLFGAKTLLCARADVAGAGAEGREEETTGAEPKELLGDQGGDSWETGPPLRTGATNPHGHIHCHPVSLRALRNSDIVGIRSRPSEAYLMELCVGCAGAPALPRSNAVRLQAQLWALWQAITMPQILLPAAFIFLWQARHASRIHPTSALFSRTLLVQHMMDAKMSNI